MTNLEDFSDDEKKTLLALSNDSYKWRTRRRVTKVTGLERVELEPILASLISQDLIRPCR